MIAAYIWWKRKTIETKSLGGLMLSISIWCFAAGLELATPTLEVKKIFTAICYVGITTMPVWFVLFAAEYTQTTFSLFKNVKWLIWLVPLISLVLHVTNRYHGLFYAESALGFANDIPYHKVVPGIWWWVHLSYSYLLIILAILLLIRMWIISSAKQRGTIGILLLSCFIPLVSNMLYISGLRPLTFIDLTPVAFAITGILFFWGIYSKRLFSVKPIALKTLFDNLPDGIIVIDKAQRIVDINYAGSQILGFEDFDPSGDFIKNILPFDIDDENSLNQVREIELKGKTLEVIQSKILNENAHRVGNLLVIRDVTAKRLTEQKLKSATDRFELAIMAAGFDPWENNLITGERMGGVKVYNEMGYTDEEIPKTVDGIFNLIHPDDLHEVKQKLDDHFQGKTKVYDCDFRVKDSKGNYQWVANYARLVERDKSGRPLRFIGLTLNINERKRTEERVRKKNEELISANAEKDKFFSIIAHDLKGPFQGFIGLTELMSENINDMSVDQMQEITQTLQVTAKNLYELLDNLLNWALIKRGHKRFNAEKIGVYALSKIVTDIVDSQIKVKDLFLNNEINSDHFVLADRESLKTILRNLISNAVKFTPRGGKIKLVSSLAEKGFVAISISDNGIGMPESISNNLFEISRGVSRPGTEQEPSTGLGLILCKELVEKHGGKIWVQSQEGEGSTFTFTLPAAS
jgi:PAS domain S-box-containing protein